MLSMTVQELRKKYIEFFTSRNHTEISGASVIPENDPTVLFTTAGMHPLVPYILGEEHPGGTRLVDYQKCIRTGDIDEVGDTSHLTFFEMLGNWSLGDYFKKEAITMSFEFLTSPEWLGIPLDKLSVSVFEGDDQVPRDQEAADIWASLGMPVERIYFLGRKHNWWGPAGETGPCGPDSEMFIDTGAPACSPDCSPACDCGKYMEIWNDVFMQYEKQDDGTFTPLARKCVDTGMGLERTATILQGKSSVYETELFQPIFEKLQDISEKQYGANEEHDTQMRIIADHIRTAVVILGDDKAVSPSNLGQGYILRRLIRRAIRFGRKLGMQTPWLGDLALVVVDMYKDVHPEFFERKDKILQELAAEEQKFSRTLAQGEHEFEKMIPRLEKGNQRIIPGRLAFKLYDTHGFPLELTQELGNEHGFDVDVEGFKKAFEKHQEASRSGSEKTFKGGLADHTEVTTALHTATHLLHEALRRVLGDHVEQKGSNITTERLRFDFSHPQPMTPEEKQKVEDIINQEIQGGSKVSLDTMTVAQAKDAGALALFTNKYEEKVKVYSIGEFSKEVCGGPHVESLQGMGRFKIKKEQSSSAGVRRIKAVLIKD